MNRLADAILERPWVLAALAAAFSMSLCGASGMFWDNDINYIIALGRSIISDGLPWADPLTCNEGLSCIAQQWLYAVTAASLYDAWGSPAVIAATVALWACALSLLHRLCSALLGSSAKAAALIAACAILLMPFMKTNPRSLDAIALLASCAAVQALLDSGHARSLAIPALSSALMANRMRIIPCG